MFCLSSFCCICFQTNNTLRAVNDSHDENDVELMSKLETCTFQTKWIEDNVTISICSKCYYRLNYSFDFLRQCVDSNKRFRNYVKLLKLGTNSKFSVTEVNSDAKFQKNGTGVGVKSGNHKQEDKTTSGRQNRYNVRLCHVKLFDVLKYPPLNEINTKDAKTKPSTDKKSVKHLKEKSTAEMLQTNLKPVKRPNSGSPSEEPVVKKLQRVEISVSSPVLLPSHITEKSVSSHAVNTSKPCQLDTNICKPVLNQSKPYPLTAGSINTINAIKKPSITNSTVCRSEPLLSEGQIQLASTKNAPAEKNKNLLEYFNKQNGALVFHNYAINPKLRKEISTTNKDLIVQKPKEKKDITNFTAGLSRQTSTKTVIAENAQQRYSDRDIVAKLKTTDSFSSNNQPAGADIKANSQNVGANRVLLLKPVKVIPASHIPNETPNNWTQHLETILSQEAIKSNQLQLNKVQNQSSTPTILVPLRNYQALTKYQMQINNQITEENNLTLPLKSTESTKIGQNTNQTSNASNVFHNSQLNQKSSQVNQNLHYIEHENKQYSLLKIPISTNQTLSQVLSKMTEIPLKNVSILPNEEESPKMEVMYRNKMYKLLNINSMNSQCGNKIVHKKYLIESQNSTSQPSTSNPSPNPTVPTKFIDKRLLDTYMLVNEDGQKIPGNQLYSFSNPNQTSNEISDHIKSVAGNVLKKLFLKQANEQKNQNLHDGDIRKELEFNKDVRQINPMKKVANEISIRYIRKQLDCNKDNLSKQVESPNSSKQMITTTLSGKNMHIPIQAGSKFTLTQINNTNELQNQSAHAGVNMTDTWSQHNFNTLTNNQNLRKDRQEIPYYGPNIEEVDIKMEIEDNDFDYNLNDYKVIKEELFEEHIYNDDHYT